MGSVRYLHTAELVQFVPKFHKAAGMTLDDKAWEKLSNVCTFHLWKAWIAQFLANDDEMLKAPKALTELAQALSDFQGVDPELLDAEDPKLEKASSARKPSIVASQLAMQPSEMNVAAAP